MKPWRIALLILALPIVAPAADGPFPKGLPRSPDFFPTAVWLQSPANAARYRAIGINVYVALWQGPTESQLDVLERAGMPVICEQSPRSLKFKDRPIIVGWMHGDEPDNAQSLGRGKGYGPPVPPLKIVEEYEAMRKADPERPVMLNLGQGVAWDGWYGRGVRTNHPEDYAAYAKGCDIASFDIYPACHDNAEVAGKLWYVPRGVDRLRQWTGGRKGVWCCIETTGIDNTNRRATPLQVRSEVWMALIHGAKGLLYFSHQFKPKFIEAGLLADQAMSHEVAAINRQVHELAPVLNAPDEPGLATVVSSSKDVPIDILARRHTGATYVFAVAMRDGGAVGTFTLSDKKDGRVEVIGEGRTIDVKGGAWTDRFAGYGVHLYRVGP